MNYRELNMKWASEHTRQTNMMDDSRGIVLEAFKWIKLIINKWITSGFMDQWISDHSITNNARHTFRVQRLYVISNLVFTCNSTPTKSSNNKLEKKEDENSQSVWFTVLYLQNSICFVISQILSQSMFRGRSKLMNSRNKSKRFTFIHSYTEQWFSSMMRGLMNTACVAQVLQLTSDLVFSVRQATKEKIRSKWIIAAIQWSEKWGTRHIYQAKFTIARSLRLSDHRNFHADALPHGHPRSWSPHVFSTCMYSGDSK